MVYQGSKARIAKDLIAVMGEDVCRCNRYVEPFVGGANMISEVRHSNRLGIDINEELIALLEAVRDGDFLPTSITEGGYKMAKSGKLTKKMTGFIGFSATYGGKYFGGYARGKDSNGKPRNYVLERLKNLRKQSFKLQGARFFAGSYRAVKIQDGDLIYCDPPYANTTGYKSGGFNSEQFWHWAKQAATVATVFVSEYNAPSFAREVWAKELSSSLKRRGGRKSVERLFKIII